MTDADAVLVRIAELDDIHMRDGHAPDSYAREVLTEADATIRALRAELGRLDRINDILNEVNAALRSVTDAASCDPGAPVLLATDGTHASLVIAWLRQHVGSRPGGYELPVQLRLTMDAAGLDYWTWIDSPPVLAAGLRYEERELWKGHTTKVYVMGEKGA